MVSNINISMYYLGLLYNSLQEEEEEVSFEKKKRKNI